MEVLKVFCINDRSIVSKAFPKSRKNDSSGKVRVTSISLIFSPINLPSRKPMWSSSLNFSGDRRVRVRLGLGLALAVLFHVVLAFLIMANFI